MPKKNPSIVVIGGGTGSFTLLNVLKQYTTRLTALVNMADDGGSTGVLRDELGVLPPGDIRQCLVALSTAPEELRELFNFRFREGTFGGHSFGNIFLSAIETMTNDFNDAVRIAGDVLRINGQVLPITVKNCQLVMEINDEKIVGQYKIESYKLPFMPNPHLYLEPRAALTDPARQSIAEASLIVIAPGNLYASLAPALLVDGLKKALEAASAPVVYVCNLVNKPNHTPNFSVHDYAAEIERFIGSFQLDFVLYNVDHPNAALLDKYALDREYPVQVDESKLAAAHYTALSGNFLSHTKYRRDSNDSFIKRSLIRHDGEAVARALLDLI